MEPRCLPREHLKDSFRISCHFLFPCIKKKEKEVVRIVVVVKYFNIEFHVNAIILNDNKRPHLRCASLLSIRYDITQLKITFKPSSLLLLLIPPHDHHYPTSPRRQNFVIRYPFPFK